MPAYTFFSNYDVRYTAKNDAEAARIAGELHGALDAVMGALPGSERQFSEIEARRGSRGKCIFHEERDDTAE